MEVRKKKEHINRKISVLLNIDIILVLLFIIPPMVLYLNHVLHGVVFTWPIFLIWILVIVYRKNHLPLLMKVLSDRRPQFFFLFSFLGIVLFNYLFIQTSTKAFQYVVLFTNFVLLLVIDSYYSTRPEKYRISILYFIIVGLGIQAAISLPYLLSAESYVIRLFSSGQLDANRSLEAIKNGIGTNGLYSSIGAIAILGASNAYKFGIIHRVILYVAIASIILSILVSTFLASILMLVTGSLILVIRYNKKLVKPTIFIFVLSLIILIYSFYENYLIDSMLTNHVESKIERFFDGKEDVTGRNNLAEVSFNTFLNNPYWGVGVPENGSYKVIGEHLPWVDYLANFGFFGVLPLYIFLFLLIKRNLKFYFKKGIDSFHRTACLIGVIIFIISNFISPMLTVPAMYTMLILFYASIGNKVNYLD